MAVGDIYFFGMETGDLLQVAGLSGTGSASSAQARTGTYSLRTNPTAGTSVVTIRNIGGFTGGIDGNFGRTAETFYTFYFRVATAPAATRTILTIFSAGSGTVLKAYCSSAREITIEGTSTSATVATLNADQWYRFDLRVTSNGTSGLSIDGGTEQTVTANNFTQDYMWIGCFGGSDTADFYWDDFVIGTTAPDAGAGPCVRMGVPIGSGNYSNWADGTGSTYAEVDEVPHDSATTYLQNTSGTSQAATFDMQSAATVGIVGTIYAVMGQATMAESTSASTRGGVRLRSGSTDSDSISADVGNTSYVTKLNLLTVDPADSAAWNSTKFDAIEVGPFKGTDSSSIRCTAAYLHVLEDGVAAGGGVTATPGVASLATTAYAPTVSVTNNQLITPAVLALVLATFAPTVSTPVICTPGTLALTLTTFSPTVLTPVVETPSTASLTTTAYAPTITISADQVVTPTTLALTTASFAPSIVTPVTTTPATAALSLTGFAPTVSTPVTATPSTASLATTAFAPTIALPVLATPGKLSLTITVLVPTVATPVVSTPDTLPLTTTGLAPTISTPSTVTPETLALTTTGFAPEPSVTSGVIIGTASLLITTYAPSVAQPETHFTAVNARWLPITDATGHWQPVIDVPALWAPGEVAARWE